MLYFIANLAAKSFSGSIWKVFKQSVRLRVALKSRFVRPWRTLSKEEDLNTSIGLLTEGKLNNVERSKYVHTLFIIVCCYILINVSFEPSFSVLSEADKKIPPISQFLSNHVGVAVHKQTHLIQNYMLQPKTLPQ